MRALLVALLACGVHGCSKVEVDEPAADEPPPPAAEPAEPEGVKAPAGLPVPGEPVVKPSDEVGPAYFATGASGLVKLDAGGFAVAAAQPEDIRRIVPGPEGELWLMAAYEIHRFTPADGRVKTLKVKDDGGGELFDRLAVGPKGELAVWGLYGLGEYDGEKWTLTKSEALATGADHIVDKGLAYDADGRLWLVSGQAFSVKVEGAWKHHEIDDYLGEFTLAPGGGMVVLHTSGVMVWRGAEAELLGTGEGYFGPNHVVLLPGDRMALAGSLGIRVLPMKAGAGAAVSFEDGTDYRAGLLNSLAGDQRGRAWVAAENGIFIVTEAGNLAHWPPGSVEPIKSDVKDIYLVGRGPDLPDVGRVKKGAVTGKVLRAGVGVPKVPVMICASPRMMYEQGEHPCSTTPWHGSSKTTQDGVFLFKDVPLGTYGLAFKAGEKWSITLDTCCTTMQEGQVYDLGTLELSR